MLQTAIEKRKREELKARRNLLFERYLKNPLDTRLALEIRIIDDQIADCSKQMGRTGGNRNQQEELRAFPSDQL